MAHQGTKPFYLFVPDTKSGHFRSQYLRGFFRGHDRFPNTDRSVASKRVLPYFLIYYPGLLFFDPARTSGVVIWGLYFGAGLCF